MLVDEISIILSAGHGGPGKLAPIKIAGYRPQGGDGGRGGNIYAKVTTDLMVLNRLSSIPEVKAGDGEKGGMHGSTGKNGSDQIIDIPVGTSIIDTESGKTIEGGTPNETILLCQGGIGGRGGNFRAQPGRDGQKMRARLVLKLIADYGFIGLPNAGKSSLLNELTSAKAEIGAYPFTTLEPNLGVINGKIIADIPGLIEGASGGKGLGIRFLKHIEKVSTLYHCIAADSEDVVTDYETITTELSQFGADLVSKSRIIILTKTDLVGSDVIENHIESLKKFGHTVLTCSIYDPESIESLKQHLN
ncbi:MAG: GTPase [Patescibacteria group bacterium]